MYDQQGVWRICKTTSTVSAPKRPRPSRRKPYQNAGAYGVDCPGSCRQPVPFQLPRGRAFTEPAAEDGKSQRRDCSDRIILESIKLNGARLAYRPAGRNGAKSTRSSCWRARLNRCGEIGLAKAVNSASSPSTSWVPARGWSPLQHGASGAARELGRSCATISAALRFPGRQSNGRDATLLWRRKHVWCWR